jgi:N-glycosylase/DNA lyase
MVSDTKLTTKKLLAEHKKQSVKISSRLKEFSKNNKISLEHKFVELCFCICTPQSQAKKVAQVIHYDNVKLLLNAKQPVLEEALRSKTRFHKNKSRYIVHARNFISDLEKLSGDTLVAREFLVANIKGLGYKEASHFLRNIGYRDLCIIDRHVISLMHELSVFKKDEPPKNPKEYLKMEKQIKDYAKKIRMDVDELDLLLWSIKTGFIFK